MSEERLSEFTFYWRDGVRQVFDGASAADALRRAGYGQGALAALDFHCAGENDEYEWINGTWIRRALAEKDQSQ